MQTDVIALTIADAVRVAGTSRTVLYEEMRAGRLPFRKLGRRTLIMRADLEAWLSEMPTLCGRRTEAA